MTSMRRFTRRTFLQSGVAALVVSGAAQADANRCTANDTIAIGVIGLGERGSQHMTNLNERRQSGEAIRLAAACDIFEPRKTSATETFDIAVEHNWEQLIARKELDAVIIAAPDHWHATMAVAAMESGKDVYCESPMALTTEDARRVWNVAEKTTRVLQIGVEQTSNGQWRQARELIANGAIGDVIWSQGSYDPADAPGSRELSEAMSTESLDWAAFVGPSEKRPFDPQRYANWRHYSDYSGGVATDLLHDKLAALLVALGPQYPTRVSAAGGVYGQEERESPNSMVMTLEYGSSDYATKPHTIVLASSMASRHGIAAIIRGDKGSIYLENSHLRLVRDATRGRSESESIPVSSHRDPMTDWLDAIRSRSACVCDHTLGHMTAVGIGMGLRAYRENKTLSWDAKTREARICAPRCTDSVIA